jgi:hypothetical protein
LDQELPKIIVQYVTWVWAIRGFDDRGQDYVLPPDATSSFMEEEEKRLSAFYARYENITWNQYSKWINIVKERKEGKAPTAGEEALVRAPATLQERLQFVKDILEDIKKQLGDDEIIEYERDLLARKLQILAKESVQMQVGIIFFDMKVPASECCRLQIANDARTRLGPASRDPDCAWRFITTQPWEEDDFREKCGDEMRDVERVTQWVAIG